MSACTPPTPQPGENEQRWLHAGLPDVLVYDNGPVHTAYLYDRFSCSLYRRDGQRDGPAGPDSDVAPPGPAKS